ncbi:glutathione S-transferase family protein [Aureimonas altamirensis]|uniref:glutathione S-transferase family protein n=1 Tax=Aureimonas altamirensis TaxID=370622 RepID=UPI0025543653|nr:glutathione S-transferase family protein [Aureimonas altamirensis]
MDQEAIFYSGTRNASSWAMRAWLALRAANFPFREVIVDIRRPQRFRNLDEIAKLSPAAAIPVLEVGGRCIFESSAIMEYANDYCGGTLLPGDKLQRARARSLIAWQHAGLSGICSRISFESAFYPYKRDLTADEQAEAARLFAHLEELLNESAGPFLFGEPGLGDFVLAPAAIRLLRHSVGTQAFPMTERWIEAIVEHELVAEWLEDADRLPHIWFDDYLIPGAAVDLNPVTATDRAATHARHKWPDGTA